MSFETCLPVILAAEGGFINDPHDPGGATNLGVTQRTLSSWLGRPATLAEIRALAPATVAPIYRARYYEPSYAGDCPPGVELMVFDEAVNQGVGRAIQSLRTALGVSADGCFGPVLRTALAAANAAALVKRIAAEREAHYRSLPTFDRFGSGWLARLARTTELALSSTPADGELSPARAVEGEPPRAPSTPRRAERAG